MLVLHLIIDNDEGIAMLSHVKAAQAPTEWEAKVAEFVRSVVTSIPGPDGKGLQSVDLTEHAREFIKKQKLDSILK